MPSLPLHPPRLPRKSMPLLAAAVFLLASGFAAVPGKASASADAGKPPAVTRGEGIDFGPTIPDPAPAPGPAPAGMAWVPGGEFSMGAPVVGSDSAAVCSLAPTSDDDSLPVHRVSVRGFWMDETCVTNAQFARFVAATGYVTVAERAPSPADFPGVPAALLVPGSAVFHPTGRPVLLNDPNRWWTYVPGANWRHPQGPGSDLKGRDRYPVVQVAYEDTLAYATWAGKRLPTEAEWEFAARGGLAGKTYVWGDEFRPGGRFMANTYQGLFPDKDTGADGFAGLAPVASYPPNGYGLYDMAGNVWQWCRDWYRLDTYAQEAAGGRVAVDPQGPADSLNPDAPDQKYRVQRGGSFLCSDQYCVRYRVGARGKGEVSSAGDNLGFRCVKSP